MTLSIRRPVSSICSTLGHRAAPKELQHEASTCFLDLRHLSESNLLSAPILWFLKPNGRVAGEQHQFLKLTNAEEQLPPPRARAGSRSRRKGVAAAVWLLLYLHFRAADSNTSSYSSTTRHWLGNKSRVFVKEINKTLQVSTQCYQGYWLPSRMTGSTGQVQLQQPMPTGAAPIQKEKDEGPNR